MSVLPPLYPKDEIAGAILTVDLAALCDNHNRAQKHVPNSEVAAVVKGDGYGCGQVRVVQALYSKGVRTFFTAHVEEAIRAKIDAPDASVYVLNGLLPQQARYYRENGIRPVLNTLSQITEWATDGEGAPAALHIDTGMSRLGLSPDETRQLDLSGPIASIDLAFVMTHLACADDPHNSKNAEQFNLFQELRSPWSHVKASFSNSAGTFIGGDFAMDLCRTGVSLYGGNPFATQASPVKPVVRLDGRILQVREVNIPESVGYGATWQANAPRRVATIGVGYADGYFRCLGDQARGVIGDVSVPLIGRVSMDLLAVDVTEADPELAKEGGYIELLGPNITVDELARHANTIPYEILTGLGKRYARRYVL